MNATFRPAQSSLRLGLVATPGFLAWGGATLGIAACDPSIAWPAGVALLSLLPFSMAALGVVMILSCFRSSLTFQGRRIIARGVWKQVELNSDDVTQLRWGPGLLVRLRDGDSRLTIHLNEYEKSNREPIVTLLHAAIRPEVQHGWNLFAYKTRYGLPERRAVGPDEVLRTRRDSRRVYLTVVATAVPIAFAAWWTTDDASPLLALPGLLAVALGFAHATPKDGQVVEAFSWRRTPEVVFLLGWGVLGALLTLVFDRCWNRLPIPALTAAAVGASWLTVLATVMIRFERARSARDEAAAEQAAAERVESGFPPNGVRL